MALVMINQIPTHNILKIAIKLMSVCMFIDCNAVTKSYYLHSTKLY